MSTHPSPSFETGVQPTPRATLAPVQAQDLRFFVYWFFVALPVVSVMMGWGAITTLLSLLSVALIDLFVKDQPMWSVARAYDPRSNQRHMFVQWLPRSYVAVQFGLLAWAAWVIATHSLSVKQVIGLAIGIGFVTGSFGITIAHELGHRREKFDQWLADCLLTSVSYGHFQIEHRRGHHARVATQDDPASARFNEPVYFFLVRSICMSWVHAWQLEAMRLRGLGQAGYGLSNRNWWYGAIQLGFLGLFYWVAGPLGALFFAVQSLKAIVLLELVNYVEHYGLTRKLVQTAAGMRYEPVQIHHSWNSDAWLTNALLFNLQRHSDHHADSSIPYEALQSRTQAPQLPTGYAGMILLSLIPPAWFAVMNPRVQAWRAQYA